MLATPGLLQVLALFAVAYAAFATVLVLWAGPYLHDVYGLGPIQRGYVLLAMAACQTVGGLCVGPLDRIFNTRKWVVVGTASLSLSMLIVLATVPLSLTGALAALLVLSASSAYGSVPAGAHPQPFPRPSGRSRRHHRQHGAIGRRCPAADADRAHSAALSGSPARTIRRSPINGYLPPWRQRWRSGWRST